mgnify:CR=1 FL=1
MTLMLTLMLSSFTREMTFAIAVIFQIIPNKTSLTYCIYEKNRYHFKFSDVLIGSKAEDNSSLIKADIGLKGNIIRSRAKWMDEGEKPTKYFLNLENRHYTNKTIPKLIKEESIEITDQKNILLEIEKFYSPSTRLMKRL